MNNKSKRGQSESVHVFLHPSLKEAFFVSWATLVALCFDSLCFAVHSLLSHHIEALLLKAEYKTLLTLHFIYCNIKG